MLRNFLAVIAGLVVGSVANMAIVTLNSSVLFPMPEGMDPNDMTQFAAYLETLPALAFVMALVAHSAQAGLGGLTAAAVGSSRPVLLALIVGGLTAVGSLMMLFMMPGPVWMWADLPLNLLCAWGAGSFIAGRRSR